MAYSRGMNVPSSEFLRDFRRYSLEARREPIALTTGERVEGYFLSEAQFARFKLLQDREGMSLAVDDLDAPAIGALRASGMDDRHDHLNSLLDD